MLVILDGWGLTEPGPGNAIAAATTPAFDRLWLSYPHTTLKTSGRDVGLTDGQMGNSEVGHLNIGAGFIVNQAITAIDLAIEDGSFVQNPALLQAFTNAAQPGKTLHLLGLVSDGGVHSHIRHLLALIDMAARHELANVAIHAFLDGRDTSPTGGRHYLREVQTKLDRTGVGRIASVIGRYYAMDRDRRWERTRIAFDLLVHGTGERTLDPIETVQQHYRNDNTDEFMTAISASASKESATTIQNGDSVIFFNFRSDRPRQLTQALMGPTLPQHNFADRPTRLTFVTMLPYSDVLPVMHAFEPASVEHPLARVVADAGLKQFHSAETEKYAHVTYFVNGGREEPFPGEERTVVPSPKVATYDLQPEMSAQGVGDAVVDAIASHEFGLIIVNFANCDMVGHTGDIEAAIKATVAVDYQLGRVVEATLAGSGTALIIADHGNAEQMLVPGTDAPMTAHTTNPVPAILVSLDGAPWRNAQLRDGGRLADVAATLLQILGLPLAPTMTGVSLIAYG